MRTPVRRIVWIILFGFFALGGLSRGWAQKALELTGERLLYRVGENEVLVYRGKVTYQDVILEAEKIHLFLDREELEAEGRVVVTRKNEGLMAEKLFYNWGKDWWKFQKVRSDVTGASIEGKLYFKGESIEEKEKTTTIEGARFTGCDLEEPHYYIEAKKIVIFPNRRVVIHNLSYFDFGRRLFSLGYYSFFLDRVDQLPLFPAFGYSRSAGLTLGYFYNYAINDYSFGTVILNWWQKNGWSIEVRHYLDNEEKGEQGKITLYYRDYPDASPTFIGKAEYRKKLDEFTSLSGSIDYSKTIGKVDDLYSLLLSVNRNREGEIGKLNLSYNASWQSESDDLSALLTYRRKVGKNLWGGLELSYLEKAKWETFEDQDLRYLFYFQQIQNKWTYTLRYYGHTDIEGDRYTGDTIQVVRKIPEFEVSRGKERIGKSDFSYSYGAVAGYYFEEETGVRDTRLNLYFDVTGVSRLGDNTTLKPTVHFEQNFYGNGFARYLWSSNLGVEQKLSSNLSVSLSYDWGGYRGATPFKFDYTTRENSFLSGSFVYTQSPWKVTLETGYDFLAGEFIDAVVGVAYDVSPQKRIVLKGNYDFEDTQWKGVSFSISWPLSAEWNVGFEGVWDLQQGDLDALRVRLTRDLHCREISLYYDQSGKTFWLEYGLKVFPGQKFKLGG